ncbi:MAG: HD domain-containing phosphohydrolase [Rhodocyclaceae bacterium]
MNVVVVDDNLDNIALMEVLLARVPGCVSRCFSDSPKALEWCLKTEPDLVILDYMMPGLDGIDVTRGLRRASATAHIPVLMVTASSETEVRHQALNEGVTDFLTRPLDITEFVARVKIMLALRRSHLALTGRAESLEAAVRRATAEIHERERETIFRLAKAAELRSRETGLHVLRVANYSQLIAVQLGLPGQDQEMILQAAPMHDVGKLGTPDHILLKAAPLTSAELEAIRRHSLIGYEILKDSASPVLQMAAQIALTHHERFDGKGYPYGLAREQIPILGRIAAVADVFDAITTERPYQRAWAVERAVEFLRSGRGTQFDPDCVDALLSEWDVVLAIRQRYDDTNVID